MDQQNPYAPPRSRVDVVKDTRCFRDKGNVVLPVGSDLPPRCIVCNAPAQLPTKEVKLYWHTPWLYLLIFVNILVYAIAALIARKTARVSPGLCQAHAARRRRRILVFLGVGVASLAAAIGLVATDNGGISVFPFLFSLLTLIAGMLATRKVHARKITDHEVHLGGCKEPFLASLE